MATVDTTTIDNEQINGAFALSVEVRFDNLASGSGQKIFERSSADGTDKIWFGQIGTSNDLEFVVVQNGVEYRTVAKGAITEGETVTWRIGVDPDGVMRISNDTEVIAQGIGAVPQDIDRPLTGYGSGLEGEIANLKIANYGDLEQLDPSNPESPCALTGESACLCGLLRPTDEHVTGERGAVVISDTDSQGDGEWSNVVALTIIPIHAIVLPDGKVLTFGSTEEGGQGGDFVYSLFDPETGVEKVLENTTGTNIFCSNMALDPETGNVIIFGGDGNRNGGGGISGIDSVTIFDYRTQTMSEAEPMDYARWYPSNITLANGDILILGGRDRNYLGSTIPEVYDGETGTFRQLTGADMPDLFGGNGSLDESWWYPHMWQNSKGEVIVVEAYGSDVYRLSTEGAGSVTKIGQTGFDSYKLNSSIMYGKDKIAIVGDDGGIYTADISDLSSAPVFTKVAVLENARTNAAMISLPDGRVLIVGGSTPYGDGTDQGNGLTNAVYTPTIWDPSDNSLEQVEAQALARLYHSSGLLLPDGSIWSGGGGAPGPLVNTNVEFLRPDYFYDETGNLAERPEITAAPKNISAGDTFLITVDDTSDISMVTAIRSGGMTHARNADTRFLELEFRVIDAVTIEVKTPDALTMGPGAWMAYVVDTKGVPSESSIIGVDMAEIVDTPPLEQTGLQYYGIDHEQINGAFELTVEARFDDLDAGAWQRVFDFGNGAAQDNIWLGQVGTSGDMRFEIWVNGTAYAITAPNVIAEGVRADWKVSVDDGGYMRMWKDGALVAEGQGSVPADVERIQNYIGDSNWTTDKRLVGEVRNLEIENGNPDPDTPPRVTVASAGDALEGAAGTTGTVAFVFSLSHVTTKDVTISYNVLGSATGAETVTIPAGQKDATVTLSFTGDGIRELNELVTVDIQDVTNGRLASSGTHAASATIIDDDVSLQNPSAEVSFFAEAVARFDDLDGGNWQRVFDYGDGPDNNNIWLGQAGNSNEMRFEILDGRTKYAIDAVDALVEGETARWTAQITNDGVMQLYKNGVLVAEGQGVVPPDVPRPNKLVGQSNWGADTPLIGEVIAVVVDENGNDDVPPVLSITAPGDAQEGASGETGTLSYVVSLDKASAVDVTAKVTIAGAGTGPATVTIPAGQTSATIDVTFQGNDTDNPDQTVTVSLSEIQNASAGDSLSASAQILDDDAPVPPVLSITAPGDAQEGASGETGTLSYLVSLDKASAVDVTAKVTIAGAGTGPATVTIPAGQTLATIDVTFQGNDTDNPDQTVTVSLSEIQNASAGDSLSASAQILDDDAPVPPVLSITAPGDAQEGASGETGTLSYVVSLDKASAVDVTAKVTIAGAGTGPATVTIPAGQTLATIDVTFQGNDTDNPDQTVTVSLSEIQNASAGDSLSASAQILDDDAPVPPDGDYNVIIANDAGGFVYGTTGNDDFRGGAGRDVFMGREGDDLIDGGAGDQDQADFAGVASDYTITRNDDGTVTFAHPQYGTDILKNIEGIWFSGEQKWYRLADLAPETGGPGPDPDPDPYNVIIADDAGGFVYGTTGNDDFRGGAGRDVFMGREGDDLIDGGAGDQDQADFAGVAADYTITRNSDGTVTFAHPQYGTDTLKNIEGIWFSGEQKWYRLADLAPETGGPGPDPDPDPYNVIIADDAGGFVYGTTGNDDFRGGAGRDVFMGREGDDLIDGGAGDQDQADYAGVASDYTITRNDDGTVTFSHPQYGTDILKNIEGIWFSGEQKWYRLADLAPETGGPGPDPDPDPYNVIIADDAGGFVYGTTGNDDFRGGAGRDVFMGREGDDLIDGGAGDQDQADFAGVAADYTITRNDDGTVTFAHPEYGTDTLKNIEGVWFSGDESWVPLDQLA